MTAWWGAGDIVQRNRAVPDPGRSMKEIAGGLGRLIETEARLAEALAAAEAEAGRLLLAAREAAEAEAAGFQQAIEREGAALATRIEAERDAEMRRVKTDGQSARCSESCPRPRWRSLRSR
jgi:hypothetical protein